MKFLLDSHTVLWFGEDSPLLPASVKSLIEDAQHKKYLSVVTAWELGIKYSTGKLTLTEPPDLYFAEVIRLNGYGVLPVTLNHALKNATLPYHHKDPFDRLLIAQSLTEGMAVLSADTIFDAYGVTRIW